METRLERLIRERREGIVKRRKAKKAERTRRQRAKAYKVIKNAERPKAEYSNPDYTKCL